jgi:hypothetical protein
MSIILSPEIASKVSEIKLLKADAFSFEQNSAHIEKLLNEVLEQLPKGVIGFTFNGSVYLNPTIQKCIPNLEEFILLPDEEEQPKESKQE